MLPFGEMSQRISPVLRQTGLMATFIIAAVILYESTQERGSPGVPDLTTNEAYVGHFAVYAAMTLCALMAIGRRSLYGMLIVVELAIGLGIAMELFQGMVPSRSSSLGDVVANTSGAVAGAIGYAMLLRLLDLRTPQPTEP